MMSVGLINPFQKFREVFICFAEFLEFRSNAFALVSLFKALPRCTNKQCSIKGLLLSLGPQFGSAVDAVKLASGVEDPPYKVGCHLSN